MGSGRNGAIRKSIRSSLALTVVVAGVAAGVTQTGKTAKVWAYVCGGVSQGERIALHARCDAYSLWVVTAAVKSGAYLAGVQVTIRDADKQVAFDGRLDRPWLYIDLPLGRFEIEAKLKCESHKRTTSIHPGDRHQAFFYFETGDAVAPDDRGPFNGNAFGAPKQ